MINEKDVVRMKIPYPSVSNKLALSSHMYICKTVNNTLREFVKCQTLKPYMLINGTMKHYCDEQPDITRNPFKRTTRIDCDKLFSTNTVKYDLGLRTDSRTDICQSLYNEVVKELEADGYKNININETELKSLNPLVTNI